MSKGLVLTAAQLGEELGLSEGSIRMHVHRGHAGTQIPPFFRLGRKVRWHREIVEQWLRTKAGLDGDAPAPVEPGRPGRPSKADKVEGRR